jgi:hypothetical protein
MQEIEAYHSFIGEVYQGVEFDLPELCTFMIDNPQYELCVHKVFCYKGAGLGLEKGIFGLQIMYEVDYNALVYKTLTGASVLDMNSNPANVALVKFIAAHPTLVSFRVPIGNMAGLFDWLRWEYLGIESTDPAMNYIYSRW